MFKVIVSENCPVCELVKEHLKDSDPNMVKYIDINSHEAQQYQPINEVPLIITNKKRYKIHGTNKRGDLIFDEIK